MTSARGEKGRGREEEGKRGERGFFLFFWKLLKEKKYHRKLKGLFFISGLLGLIGRAKRSSSPSAEGLFGGGVATAAGFPCSAALRDMGAAALAPPAREANEGTAKSSLPEGDRVCENPPAAAPVKVFAFRRRLPR